MGALEGKRTVVCGSTRGIGRACAERFAAEGASVTLVARDGDTLARLVTELPAPSGGPPHDFVVGDHSEPERLAEAVAAHVEKTSAAGPHHVLVNNTGGPPGGSIIDADAAAFVAAFEAHLVCNQRLSQVLLPGMKSAGYGRIVNVISTSVRIPIPGLGVSNTVRAAVAGWAKTLSNEVARHGITVNNVLPGFTETDRLRSIIESKAGKSGRSSEEIASDMVSSIPAGRFGTAAEIAAVAAFLASPDAAYVNGVSIPVDGGRTGCL